jgi:hypothetical protein
MSPPDDIDVRSQLAVMNAQIQTLTKTVDVLAEEVKSLTALANQGKGSLRTLLIVGGLWTGLVAFLSFAAGIFLGNNGGSYDYATRFFTRLPVGSLS